MLSDKDIALLKRIKEAPSNLSQDNIRTVYNKNFALIRELLESILDGSAIDVISGNANIEFPTNPDKRLQYVLKYNVATNKWVVSEFLGTQSILTNDDAIKIGSKHQHIVSEHMVVGSQSEVMVETGGELVVLLNTFQSLLYYEIGVTESLEIEYAVKFLGIGFNGTGDDVVVLINGNPISVGDDIMIGDELTLTGEDGVVHLNVERI